jgi:hypothetical protein
MAALTLGCWIATAFVGAYLFTYASDGGRAGSGALATHLHPLVLFAHPLLGLVGIGVWIGFIETNSPIGAWLGVAVLAGGIALGGFMGLRTERPRKADEARLRAAVEHGGALVTERVAELTVAEQRIPRPAIALHGLFAGLTFVLALVCALRS